MTLSAVFSPKKLHGLLLRHEALLVTVFWTRADFVRTDWCAKHYGGLSQTQNGWQGTWSTESFYTVPPKRSPNALKQSEII